jgi:hypothetical protein
MGRDEKGGIVKVGERISGYCQGIWLHLSKPIG